MSTTIEFYKTYSRQSRSMWADNARVVMTFDAESKAGVYLHLGDFGINGFSISKGLQSILPSTLQKQYIEGKHIDIVMHIFRDIIENYCQQHVSEDEFKEVFLLNQTSFFSDTAKAQWLESYNVFLKQTME